MLGSGGWLRTHVGGDSVDCDCGPAFGRDAATLSVGGGLHYDWAYLTQAPIAFFVRYELMWEMPYAQGFSEVIPYHVMSLGLRFTPLRKKPRRWAEKSGGR